MLEVLEAMSLSRDRVQRVEAARLVARLDPAHSAAIVLRLLRDPVSAVTEAMAAALLRWRREAAIPLILRSLRQDPETDETLLECLLNSELDGVEVRATIVLVLVETGDPHEIAGALEAIGWLAPSGGFPAPPAALARVNELSGNLDRMIRTLAGRALAALHELQEPPETSKGVG